MLWDNGVNKKAIINTVATTFLIKPMTLIACDGAAVMIICPRQVRFYPLSRYLHILFAYLIGLYFLHKRTCRMAHQSD